MAWNQAPDDLPAHAVSILVAIIASCIGYVLFSQRYGEPIREMKAAVARLEHGAVKAEPQPWATQPAQATMAGPAMTDQELADRIESVVADRFNGNQQLIADLNGRIRELEKRVAAAESRPVPSNSSMQIYADRPTQAPVAQPEPTPSGPPRARLVDIYDNVRIELSNPRMMGSRGEYTRARLAERAGRARGRARGWSRPSARERVRSGRRVVEDSRDRCRCTSRMRRARAGRHRTHHAARPAALRTPRRSRVAAGRLRAGRRCARSGRGP